MSGSKIGVFGIVCGIVLSISGGLATAAPMLDQESPNLGFGFNAGSSSWSWQQGVTVGITGQLTRIELYARDAGTTPLYINSGAPWQSDAGEFATTFVAAGSGWTGIDTSAAGLFFNAGDQFVIGVGGTDSGLWVEGSYLPPNGAYAAGELWITQFDSAPELWTDGEKDLAFRTYVEPATIPAPAAVVLGAFGASLVGWLRRRRSL